MGGGGAGAVESSGGEKPFLLSRVSVGSEIRDGFKEEGPFKLSVEDSMESSGGKRIALL